MPIVDRLQHAWNAFVMNKDPTFQVRNHGMGYAYRPDRPRLTRGNERSIITSVYNRIALDAAAINVQHVRLDENDRFVEIINSGLNECLNVDANVDQTGRALIQDAVMSMLDEGCIAIVPTDTTIDPVASNSYDINELRVGKVIEWYPSSVRVLLYNERNGRPEEITVPKKIAAIIENPLYAVMNEPNSTMQRLIRKLNLLDVIDEQSGAGKLDLIIQLPYVIKTDARRQAAEKRRKDIEMQLAGSKYGIAYADGTEHITQLNRSVDNNLMSQIEYLTSMLYSQLGITTGVMDGTADEKTMNNYYTRTIEPILSAIVDEMRRKFLTKTARSQGQSVRFFRDPFKLVPVTELPDIVDKFTRNEVMTSNEMRQVIGMKPSKDPNADQLRNKNLNQQASPTETPQAPTTGEETTEQPVEDGEEELPMTEEEYLQNIKDLDDLDAELDKLESELDDDNELKHYASDYYDPVKAHEYYERTKELKGRKSTAKLNDDGKAAAKYVKEQLTAEKKGKVENEQESMKSQIESYKTQMKAKIEFLRAKLKSMSKSEKATNKESIKAEIAGLREDNKAMRESLRSAFKQTKVDLKTEYDEKYISELDKIRNTSSFQKVSKRKSGSKSKKSYYLK